MAEEDARQIAERAAVEAMKHAKKNMETVLDRVSRLERALGRAADVIRTLKPYIPENAYGYRSEIKVQSVADEGISEIAKVLA